jgi:hypothetical protein
MTMRKQAGKKNQYLPQSEQEGQQVPYSPLPSPLSHLLKYETPIAY